MHHWSNDLSTGFGAIDHQHQELFALVTMLDSALHSPDAQTKRHGIENMIRFLEQYVEDHFADEEEIMLSHDYVGYNVHKDDHEIFKARVHSLRHDFDSGLPIFRVMFALRMFIDKLVHHIKTIDIGIAKLHAKKDGK